jgi:hypothetical protein
MPTLFVSPTPITGILPHDDNYRQKALSQELEEHNTLLHQNSSEPIWPKSHRRIVRANIVAVVLFFLTIVVGSMAWLGVSATLQKNETSNPSKLYTDCGSNYSTAIAAGCIYDIVAPQWTPPECYNAALSKEHAIKIPKPMFFRWSNLTEPIPEDPLEISQHETIWTFDEYHTIHCVYILELAALAAAVVSSGHQGVYLNHIAANSKHTKHCTELLSSNITSPGPTEIRHPGAALHCDVLAP